MTFRLGAGTTEADFLAADRRVQTEFFYGRPGLARGTTARGGDGNWLVVVLWADPTSADAASTAAGGHPAVAQFEAAIEASSVATERYETLD